MIDRLQTHFPGCWRDRHHHACAVRLVDELCDLVGRYRSGDNDPELEAEAQRVLFHIGERPGGVPW